MNKLKKGLPSVTKPELVPQRTAVSSIAAESNSCYSPLGPMPVSLHQNTLIMGFFSFLSGNSKGKQIQAMMDKRCILVDVRTPQEFAQGHIKGAVNMPLQQLNSQVKKLKETGKPVITCCRSGMRSASATNILKSAGIECMNGGGWESLNEIINSSNSSK